MTIFVTRMVAPRPYTPMTPVATTPTLVHSKNKTFMCKLYNSLVTESPVSLGWSQMSIVPKCDLSQGGPGTPSAIPEGRGHMGTPFCGTRFLEKQGGKSFCFKGFSKNRGISFENIEKVTSKCPQQISFKGVKSWG